MSSSSPGNRPRVRHHTSEAKLDLIRAENAIHVGRISVMTGRPCVHVELEPFGSTRPTPPGGCVRGSPSVDLGIPRGRCIRGIRRPSSTPSGRCSGRTRRSKEHGRDSDGRTSLAGRLESDLRESKARMVSMVAPKTGVTHACPSRLPG